MTGPDVAPNRPLIGRSTSSGTRRKNPATARPLEGWLKGRDCEASASATVGTQASWPAHTLWETSRQRYHTTVATSTSTPRYLHRRAFGTRSESPAVECRSGRIPVVHGIGERDTRNTTTPPYWRRVPRSWPASVEDETLAGAGLDFRQPAPASLA